MDRLVGKDGRPLKERPGLRSGVYRHYRTGRLYRVHGVFRHSERPNKFHVAYEAVDGGEAWTRPYRLFTMNVLHEGRIVPRFDFVEDGAFVWRPAACSTTV